MKIKKSQMAYILALVFCFAAGAYYWRLSRLPVKLRRPPDQVEGSEIKNDSSSILVYVNDKPITTEDVDFEYSLSTKDVFGGDDLSPVPDLGARFEAELTPLKERLLSDIIERKLLYNFLSKDHDFSIEDPSRYTSCLKDWQASVSEVDGQEFDAMDRERLKERICEQSIVQQYLDEKIFSSIDISEAEEKEFYEKNKKLFVRPRQVLLRQIVFKTEEEAKNARKGLTRSNFAAKAKELSITPEGKDGGLVGPFGQGEMPRFFDLAFSLPVGEIYSVLKSNYGYHIILLEKKIPKTNLKFEQAKADIRKKLMEDKREEEYKKWLEVAVNAVSIKTPGSKL